MDIFDRIAAAIVALRSGTPANDPAVKQHLDAIDATLTGDEAHEAAVSDKLDALAATEGSDHTEEDARVSTIEAGLQKLADALSPALSQDAPSIAQDQAPATTATGTVAPVATTGAPVAPAPAGPEVALTQAADAASAAGVISATPGALAGGEKSFNPPMPGEPGPFDAPAGDAPASPSISGETAVNVAEDPSSETVDTELAAQDVAAGTPPTTAMQPA